MIKTCKTCNENKALDQFHKGKSNPDGHRYDCKGCKKAKSAVYHAKKRAISFDLTFDEFLVYWQADCNYCGDQVPTVGIDRVDSSLGYTLTNCTSRCSMCNFIKKDHDKDILNMHPLKMLKHQGIV